jgi:hypothetical protein
MSSQDLATALLFVLGDGENTQGVIPVRVD